MHHDAPAHQARGRDANNRPMHEKTRDNIRELAKKHGIESERQLALGCGMDQSTLHRFLSGKTDTLNFLHLQSLAHHFDLTVSQLIGETPIEADPKIRSVVVAMQALPEYKKDALVATSQALLAAGEKP